MIKKILLFSLIIIFVPYIIVTLFIRDDEITFNFSENSVVRVYREETGIIERVPLEEYVTGVLAGEMPINFEIEALKAQAVAARSYVMVQIERNINNDYDVVDTVMNQVYLDRPHLMSVWKESYIDNINKLKLAVISTKGEYISYDNRVAEALFFSTSSGLTENSEDVFSNKVSYLRSVDSHWDEVSPAFSSTVTYSLKEFYTMLNLDYNENLEITNIDRTSTGRVKSLIINDKTFSGSSVASKLSLRSSNFDIILEDTKVIIKTKGYGHGVGMSQYGANGMAIEGYNYKDILKHYYTNVEIKKI